MSSRGAVESEKCGVFVKAWEAWLTLKSEHNSSDQTIIDFLKEFVGKFYFFY